MGSRRKVSLEEIAARIREAREKLHAEMTAVKRELGREEDELVFVGMSLSVVWGASPFSPLPPALVGPDEAVYDLVLALPPGYPQGPERVPGPLVDQDGGLLAHPPI